MAPSDPLPIDMSRVDAAGRFRAHLICAFASFGGILFGYDSGYISKSDSPSLPVRPSRRCCPLLSMTILAHSWRADGVLGMAYVKEHFGHPGPSGFDLSTSARALIVSILSAGTFVGALVGGQSAAWIGRRVTIMLSCLVFAIGVAIQIAATHTNTLVVGRLIAGLGVGGVSSSVIIYVSEISPRKIRGVLVSLYQWAITIGLLIASCVAQGTKGLASARSYRIPIALQLIWAGILAAGLFFLPESPRYHVKRGDLYKAGDALARVRGLSRDSDLVAAELREIQANYEYECGIASTRWLDCFRGNLKPAGTRDPQRVGSSLQAD